MTTGPAPWHRGKHGAATRSRFRVILLQWLVLFFQPGEGSTLLICDAPEATATRIAGDIARALAGKVVWAWPDPEGSPQSPTLDQAIGQYLFTRVVVFGDYLARKVFRGDAPLVTGSASITISVGLDELAVRGNAKQVLWKQISGKSN